MKKRHVDTLGRIYRRLPPRLRGAVPAPLKLWLRHRLTRAAGIGKPNRQMQGLVAKLWGGYSHAAIAEIETLLAAPDTGRNTAAAGARALARWHGAAGDFETALAFIRRMGELQPASTREREQYICEALFLCRLGRAPEARRLLETRLKDAPFDVSDRLMWANTWNPAAGAAEPAPEAEARMLAEMNAIHDRFGLSAVAKRDARAPLSLDNLGPASSLPAAAGPKVTVIVPLWNAEDTIGTALRGLAEQTHENLEVLVVDDLSTDGSADLVFEFTKLDPRFRLIRQSTNGGSYVARNRALAEAAGEFVTVHDSDDWSHPEKIARHAADLAARDVPFNISAWARVTPELLFIGAWRPDGTVSFRNFSSVFFRRELIDRTGPWDTARISADREFVNRVQSLHGLTRQWPFLSCPLAFGRVEKNSLTQSSRTHVVTMYHGIRREYHEASDLWHKDLGGIEAASDQPVPTPPYFPAPLAVRADRPASPRHDVLFVGDFNFLGGTQKSAMNMIAAARRAGLDTALLHYRRHDQDVTKPLRPEVRRAAWDSGVRIVAPGESLRAKTVVVTYPPILDEIMDRFPEVDHDHLAVVVNQMAERDLERSDVAYDPARVRAHLTEILGSEGVWAPISARVRTLMEGDPRYPAPAADTWTPLIDTDLWCIRRPEWRGEWRTRPVIGRHGRDHPLKWPADPEELRAAYCAGRNCEVRFLGGAVHARANAGPWPANWRVEAFGARDVRDFLADLDVFLHFPDRSYIEEFGRAPMEAMAMGVPVILPPEFEPTFGPAALYSAPEGVWPLVEHLWRDRAAWEARVAAGRAFVHATCGYGVFPGRLARIAGAAAGPAPIPGPERLPEMATEGMATDGDPAPRRAALP